MIDTLLTVFATIKQDPMIRQSLHDSLPFLDSSKKMLLVIGHRREDYGSKFEQVCQALIRLARQNGVQIVYSVHPNPDVRESVHRVLGNIDNIQLIVPQDYLSFGFLHNHRFRPFLC